MLISFKRINIIVVVLLLAVLPLVPFSNVNAASFSNKTLSGKILDSTGAPLEGALVALQIPSPFEYRQVFQYPSGTNWGFENARRSQADGSFSVAAFAGHYDILVIPPLGSSYLPRHIDNYDLSDSSTLDIHLDNGARHISGKVTDSYGQPVINGVVRFVSSDGQNTYFCLTDSNGHYEINVAPGMYNKAELRSNVYEGGPFGGGPYDEAYIEDPSVNLDATTVDATQDLQINIGHLHVTTGGSYSHLTVQAARPDNTHTSLTGLTNTGTIDFSQSVKMDLEGNATTSLDTTLLSGIDYIVCWHRQSTATCKRVTPSVNSTTYLDLSAIASGSAPTGLISTGNRYSLRWTLEATSSIYADNQSPSIVWNTVSGASAYRVYRDGQMVGETTVPNYIDTSATPGGRYVYSVTSIDSSGAESTSSDQIVIEFDNTGPSVSSAMSLTSFDKDTLSRIYASATDDMADLGRVEYYIDNDPGLGNASPLYLYGETSIAANTMDPTNLAVGNHVLYSRAQNVAGEWSATSSLPFTVLPTTNTQSGENVTVTPIQNVSLTFENVSQAGGTTAVLNNAPPTPPAGFKLGNPPQYYNISTTATFTGSVTVCMTYDPSTITGPEANLRLMHFDSNGWTDITSSIDTDSNTICGITTSFSGFGVLQKADTDGLVSTIKAMNLQQGITNSLDAKLQDALDAKSSSAQNDTASTLNKLNSVLNEISAQRGNMLTIQQADTLTAMTNELITYYQ